MVLASMDRRQTICWYCAPNQTLRARFEPGWRCAKCAMELDEIPRYTPGLVLWAMGNFIRWKEKGQTRPELADMEDALDWVRKSQRISDFEKYTLIKRIVGGCSLKAVAGNFDVTDSAVSRCGVRVARKIAVFLNSKNPEKFS